MAGTKRMSAEEKRKTILDIYHKSKSVFTEKEIITLSSKAGVNTNTVADINQALIDDGFVDKAKIGGSNYFWSFPAKKDRTLQLQHETVLAHIETLKASVGAATADLANAKRGRQDDAAVATVDGNDTGDKENQESSGMSRAQKLQRLTDIAKERAEVQAELQALGENDPQALADLEKELELVKDAANRWTDNLFNCKTYLTKKRGMEKKEADRFIGITSAFDYPDDKIPK